jgi:hypothetical protein
MVRPDLVGRNPAPVAIAWRSRHGGARTRLRPRLVDEIGTGRRRAAVSLAPLRSRPRPRRVRAAHPHDRNRSLFPPRRPRTAHTAREVGAPARAREHTALGLRGRGPGLGSHHRLRIRAGRAGRPRSGNRRDGVGSRGHGVFAVPRGRHSAPSGDRPASDRLPRGPLPVAGDAGVPAESIELRASARMVGGTGRRIFPHRGRSARIGTRRGGNALRPGDDFVPAPSMDTRSPRHPRHCSTSGCRLDRGRRRHSVRIAP